MTIIPLQLHSKNVSRLVTPGNEGQLCPSLFLRSC